MLNPASYIVACFYSNPLVYYLVCCLLLLLLLRQLTHTAQQLQRSTVATNSTSASGRADDEVLPCGLAHQSTHVLLNGGLTCSSVTHANTHGETRTVAVQVVEADLPLMSLEPATVCDVIASTSPATTNTSCSNSNSILTQSRVSSNDAELNATASATSQAERSETPRDVSGRHLELLETSVSQSVDSDVTAVAAGFVHDGQAGTVACNNGQLQQQAPTVCGDGDATPAGRSTASPDDTETRETGRVGRLEDELRRCRQQLTRMKMNEQQLRDRLCDQARVQFEREDSNKFEDISLSADCRPTLLVRRYSDIYSDDRPDVLDALDCLPDLADTSDQLKQKLIYSVLVLCFRAAEHSLHQLRRDVRTLLRVDLIPHRSKSADVTSSSTTGNDVITGNGSYAERLATSVDGSVMVYLRKTAHLRDVTAEVEAVCDQLWTTLGGDCSGLKACPQLRRYAATCMRLAWSLSVQCPAYAVYHDECVGEQFSDSRHVRYYTSNADSNTVRQVVWPGLVERSTAALCVCRAVVIT